MKRKLSALIGICLVLPLVAVTFLGACAKPAPPAEKTLRIGIIGCVTGFGSGSEIHEIEAIEAVRDLYNAKGGVTINGEKYLIETVTGDIKGTAEGAVAAAEKLVYSDKMNILVGATVPFMNAAVGTVTEKAHAIHASCYIGTPQELNANMPYTFICDAGSEAGIAPSLDYLVENYPDLKKIGLFFPDDGNLSYLEPKIKAACEARGLELTSTVLWPMDTVDFYPIVTKLLASNPDTLTFMNGWEQATGAMTKGAREQGFKNLIFQLNYDSIVDIISMVGKDNIGDFFNHGWAQNTSDPLMPEEMKTVINTMTARVGKFHQWHLFGWSAMSCTLQAIENAQSTDPTVVANAWRQMKSLKTPYGQAPMGGLKTYGVNNYVCCPVAITAAVNGEAKFIKWYDSVLP